MRVYRFSFYLLTVVLGLMATVYLPAAGDPAGGPVPSIDADAEFDRPAWPIEGLTADQGCEVVGGSTRFTSNSYRYRTDVFHMDYLAKLTQFKIELLCVEGTEELYFSVHERCPGDPTWTRVTDVEDEEVVVECNPAGDFSSRIYSSNLFDDPGDPNDLPVWLLAECDYALGVAWGDRVITYFSNSSSYPKPFSAGQVLGLTGISPEEFPVPDELAFPPLYTDGAYSMQICLAPQPGACCLPSDECQDLTEMECLAGGGQFTAQRFFCAQLEDQDLGCPLEEAGCCLPPDPGGPCVDLDLFSCEANGGGWRRGEVCSPTLCLPRGACCLAYGACAEMTAPDCLAEPGFYQGDDTTCPGIGPACSFGACCVDGVCVELTEVACADRPGTWHGHGSNCDGNPCDVPGACCTPDGCLDGMSVDACLAIGGEPRGDWTTCGTLMPDCGLGACCTDLFGGCLDNTTLAECEDPLIFAGTFQGEGTRCTTLDPQCRDSGACCFGAGFCGEGWTSAVCEARDNNVFLGDLLTCRSCFITGQACADDDDCKRCSISLDPCQTNAACPDGETCEVGGNLCTSNCPPSDPQACCLPNGTCVTATVAACTSLFGTAQGVDSTCAGLDPGTCDPAPDGACCLSDGQCAELSAIDCAVNGGAYEGDGIPCALDLCGACCRDDGTCDSASLAGCLAPGEHFYSGQTCAVCPPTGACCLPDQTTCVIIPQGACAAQDGLYHGDGSACPPDCSRGACCGHNGICMETTATLCSGDVGTYVGGSCALADCPAAEACCLPDGSCASLTVARCEDDLGGQSQGPDTVCGSDTCTHGACCFEAEGKMTCEVLTEDTCADPARQGAHQGIGTECEVDTCTFGACCLPDGRCAILTVAECAAVNGDHQGAGEECVEGETCTHGACCLPEGGCLRLTIGLCADREPPGWHRGVDTECDAPDICTRGCCCRHDGTWEDLFKDECPEDQGVFFPGLDCFYEVDCPPAEACCLPDESCATLTAARCVELGGVPRGGDITCADAICIPGACCRPNGTCVEDAFQDECESPDGVFQPRLACFDADCPPAGACCTPGGGGPGTCEQLTAGACAEVEGRVYFGDNVHCDDTFCPGACCRIGGSCLLAVEADCGPFNGEFAVDQDCGAIECDGACCLPDGSCFEGAKWECAATTGAEFTPGQSCLDITCERKGACCDEGACFAYLTPQQCGDVGGVYQEDGQLCDPDLCLFGGCCHLDGTCENGLVASECALDDDIFNTAGCGNFLCPARGACCLDGLCEIRTEDDCTAEDGLFGLVGRECDDHACDEGACCSPRPNECSVVPVVVCEADGGVFDPENSSCGSVCNISGTPCETDDDCPGFELCRSQLCARGACCTADGDCLDFQVDAQCRMEGDDFFPGQTCVSVGPSCDPKRACCMSEVCFLKTQDDCTNSGGTYWENVTNCTDDLCRIGGCCRADGTCTDTQVGAQCRNDDGIFQGPGTLCVDDWCHACCLDDGSCQDTLENVCVQLTGDFGSPARCVDDPCLGACCHPDGQCADLTATECANVGGAFDPAGSCGSTTCEAFGACCLNGQCAVQYVSDCTGYYVGDGEPCTEGLCVLGACCTAADHTCADLVVAAQCDGPLDVFREGATCGVIPCDEPRGACCVTGSPCKVRWQSECAAAAGVFFIATPCDPDPCVAPEIASSDPPNNVIDARQPHPIGDDSGEQGWDSIEITFSGVINVAVLEPADFIVEEIGDDGVPPSITAVDVAGDNTVRLSLSDPIDPDAWTAFTHVASDTTTCLGYLPADVGQNGQSKPEDIDALIDCFNADPPCELWESDANRSGALNAQDILREIDLLNGAGSFTPWVNRGLGPSPCN